MLAQVTCDGPGVGVVTAAGGAADDDANGLALVEGFLREEMEKIVERTYSLDKGLVEKLKEILLK